MRDSTRKKLYSIVETDPASKALAMHIASRGRAKLGGVTYRMKLPEKPEGMKEEQHWEGLMAYGQKA